MLYAAASAGQSGNCSPAVPSVLTYHYDNCRTGQNTQETILTPSNVSSSVNPNQFGRLFARTVDNRIVGQPLYMPNLSIAGGTHNVVFVATESDSVYAFDADSNTGANANPLWHISLIDALHGANSGETVADAGGGVTSTPVIDPSSNIMYVEAKSQLNTTYFHRLHALDVLTGNEKSFGPVVITGSVPGTGGGGTTVNFSDTIKNQMNRPGLLLLNGVVYVGFASDGGDFSLGQYYGWVFAYSASNLARKGVFNTTPNGIFNGSTSAAGGIWMSGAGLAADSSGNVYFATGNGIFDSNSDFGDSILKLTLGRKGFTLSDWFTPFNQDTLNNGDLDLGSGGVLLLPDQTSSPQHLLVQVGKGDTSGSATVYLLNRDQLTTDGQHYCNGCPSDHVQQELTDAVGRMWGTPTYWNSMVYLWGTNDTLRAYRLTNSALSTSPAFVSTDQYIHSANTSISANGNSNGILWAAEAVDQPPPGTPAMILNAYDATNANRIYSSSDNDGRDNAGGDVHFLVPVVTNGKVYLGGTQLSVYGQNPPDFTLSVSPTSQSFPSGGGTENYAVTVTSVNSFNAPVNLTLTNLPGSTTRYSCSPNPVNGGSGTSTCAVTTDGSTPIGSFNFNINGSGGGINHTISATLVQHGTVILRPTAFSHSGCLTCIDYNNAANAFDGNLSTFASGPAGALDQGSPLWTSDDFTGFGPVTGSPTAINLKVSSAYSIGPNDFVYITYSTASTSGTIYVFSSAASRGQQTDVVSLPTGTNLSSVDVQALVGNHSTASQQIYEIWIEVIE